MSVEIRATIQGQQTILAILKNMERRATDSRGLMARLATLGFTDVMEHFRKEQGPEGRWKPLAPSTIERRRKGKKARLGTKILQDTGRLRGSILPEVTGPRMAKIGTSLSYAAIHQFGQRGIPSRPFMWLSTNAKTRMQDFAFQWVRKG